MKKPSFKDGALFVKNHLIKLMSGYWFIFIIFVPAGLLFGKNFITVYSNPLHGIIDFFGMAYLFETPTMNATWWFMTPIIVYYILFPFLVKLLDYSAELLLCLAAFLLLVPYVPYNGQIRIWLLPFAFGMYFAKRDCFYRIQSSIDTLHKRIVFCSLSLPICLLIRYSDNHNVRFDSVFAIIIVLFSFFIISQIPILNKILEHLGKHTGAIFMFHTFIYSYYFHDFIYWIKYCLPIFIVMTIVCYLIAVGLEYIKKLIRYNKLIRFLINCR